MRWLTRLFARCFGSAAAGRKPVVEELEPRILYSADANPLLWGGAPATAIVGSIEPNGERESASLVDVQRQQERRRELVFIDVAVPNHEDLLADVLAQRGGDGVNVEIVRLRADADGIDQVSAALQGREGVDALHFITHGSRGAVLLGDTRLDSAALTARGGEIAAWRESLAADADILLYGCDVGQGSVGAAFVGQLALTTAADVAASTDATGHESLGGNWQLEASTGRIEARVVVGVQQQAQWVALLPTYEQFTSVSSDLEIKSDANHGQTFAHTSGSGTYSVNQISMFLRRDAGASAQTITVQLRDSWNGTVLASASIASSSIGTTAGWVDFNFGAVALNDGQTYTLRIGSSTTDGKVFTGYNGSGGYANGTRLDTDGSTLGSEDLAFRVAGTSAPAINVSVASGLSTTEGGGSAQFSVVLAAAPSADVTISVASSDTSEATVSTALLTFTSANWSTPQLVTVTGVNDALADGFQPYTIMLGAASSGDAGYNGLNPADVQGATSDDDVNYGQIAVDTASDAADGDTSSLAALAANRGADGAISLREAIIAANNSANGVGGADRIVFNIAGTGTHIITPSSALPVITGAVVIDASTDDSFAANGNRPAIVLDGNNLGLGTDGLVLSSSADGSTIRGLVIQDWGGDGIEIQAGSDGHTIAGNYIGRLTTDGTDSGAGTANNGAGINVFGANNTIGGVTAADRNVISGNVAYGISLEGAGASSNTIAGNFIGLTATGTAMLGNGNDGVFIINGAINNTVGGATAAHRNVIAGNSDGVQIGGASGGSNNNVVRGNYIGTDVTGTLDFGNNDDGVDIDNAALDNQVIDNLIAGNTSDGIDLGDAGASTGTLIRGNLIGTRADGLAALGNSGNGILIGNGGTANGTIIGGTVAGEGNTISGNAGRGIHIVASTGVVIRGNTIGLGSDGSTLVGNAGSGIEVNSANHIIGGTTAGARNVISGNAGLAGVLLQTSAATGNVVLGNYIGTDATGLLDRGNAAQGVGIWNSASGNTVGGATAGARNLIAGNGDNGVIIANAGTSNNAVQGNWIGLDVTGTATLGNDAQGVWIGTGATNNTVGGSGAGMGNVIGGNAYAGVEMRYAGTSGNIVQGNWIGTDASGTANLGNGGGVLVHEGASNNLIGGTSAGAGNVVAFGTGYAVVVIDNDSVGNRILGNSIRDNAGLGIELGTWDGVTPNDAGDADIGANALQNFPVIATVVTDPANSLLGIVGTLDSTANTTFRIEFFFNTSVDSSGHGEGQTYWSFMDVTTDGAGNGTFNLYSFANVPVGTFVTATATNTTTGDTSEFSAAVAAVADTLIVDTTADNVDGNTASTVLLLTNKGADGRVSLREAIIAANNTAGGDFINFNIAGAGPHTINVLTALPSIDSTITIDATSEPDFAGTPMVEINGDAAGGGVSGLYLTTNADGSTVRGLVVNRFANHGIVVSADNVTIVGNFIGIGTDGSSDLGNAGDGILLDSSASNATIGGVAAADRNVVSGNNNRGISVSGVGTGGGHLIVGNYVGLNAAGTAGVGNSNHGIDLSESAGNTVRGNVVSANGASGVIVYGEASDLNRVIGNFMGTNAAGTAALGNANNAVTLGAGADDNTVGGTTVADRNLLSGNVQDGVFIGDVGTSGNVVAGNFIGTNAAGTAALANGRFGVVVYDGASANLIGGTTAGAGNLISGNGNAGIQIDANYNAATTGNLIQGNLIGLNATGLSALGNSNDGIRLIQGVNGMTIGGTTAAARNVIGGNLGDGIELSQSDGTVIAGNWIGTDAAGSAAVGNVLSGVRIAGASNTVVGGNGAGSGNVISGNGTHGVRVTGGAASAGTVIAGNLIGLNAAGTAALGNAQNGVLVQDTAGVLVGGGAAGARNVISGNGQWGIDFSGNATTSGWVRGNFIGTSASGTAAVGNAAGGVRVGGGAGGIVIGGATAAERNLISGNGGIGVSLAVSSSNLVQGNYIGTTVSGNAALGNGTGVMLIDASSNTLRANVISANAGDGVLIDGASADNNTVAGNTIGLGVDGNTLLGNGQEGIQLSNGADGNIIGGTTVADRNVISGNAYSGILLWTAAGGNLIAGNYIGTNAAGNAARGNQYAGIIVDGSDGVVIGGTAAGAGNVIAGNLGEGIYATGASATVIRGNFIGVAADGSSALGNAAQGIEVFGGSGNVIGGTAAGAGNVIAGNAREQVYLNGSSSNTLQGNRIGTNAAGTAAPTGVGTVEEAIRIDGGSNNNLIGGTIAGAGNVIAFNDLEGIYVGGASTGNAILGNAIHSNTASAFSGLGIQLGLDGVTANDALDADGGPNDLQNFPLLTSANSVSGDTTIAGTLNTTANTTLRLEFFSSPTGDASGYGEGMVYLGFVDVTTDAAGNASFNTTLSGVSVITGHRISATATVDLGSGNYGSTSEFSAHIACTANTAPVNTVPGAQAVNEDTALVISGVSVADADGNLSTVRLTVGNGTVSVSLAGGAVVSTGANGSATVTLAGTQAQINAALAAISYQGSADFNGSDTLTVLSTDGNSQTDSDTVAITVNAVNDAPTLAFGEGNRTFTEGALAVIVDALASVSDVDSANFDTGTLTVTLSANASADDRVELLNTGMGAGQIGVSGVNVYYGGTLIGMQGGGIGAVPFTVTFNASADATAVREVMRNIRFWVAGDAPSTATRTVQAVLTDGDGGASATASKQIAVVATNDDPVITSDGGGATTALSVAENTTAVTTVTSTDVDGGAPTYLIFGGADAVRFTIDANSGALAFVAAPDFEAPSDANADNVYQVTVWVSDGAGGIDTQVVSVTVTNAAETPVNTVPGAQSVNEDTALVITGVSVADADGDVSTVRLTVGNGTLGVSLAGGAAISAGANGSATLTLSGTQAQINAALAAITYQGHADFNGSDTLTVLSTDANSATDSDTVAITVNAVNDAPVMTAVPPDVTFVEGNLPQVIDSNGTVSDIDSADFDGSVLTVSISANASTDDRLVIGNFGSGPGQVGVSGGNVTYGGVVVGTFSGGSSGADPLVITFDANASVVAVQAVRASVQFDNVSDMPSTASRQITFALTDGDGGTALSVSKLVHVQAVNDDPVIGSDGGGATASVTVAENTTAVTTVTSTDVDGGVPTYAISGGADAARFTIDTATGALRFIAAPDFDNPADAGADNVYDVQVSVADGNGGSDVQDIAVSVTDTAEAPLVSVPAAQSVSEDTVLALTGVSVSDADGDLATVRVTVGSGTLNVSLAGGASVVAGANDSTTLTLAGTQAQIDAALVTLTYLGAADFFGSDTLTVLATDALGASTSDTVAITVTAVNDAPMVTSGAAFSIAENTSLVTALASTDVDGGAPAWSIAGGADAARFSIDSVSGQVSFMSAPSFESSADADGDNVHQLVVAVDDGNGGVTQHLLSITVTDVNEAPTLSAPATASLDELSAAGTLLASASAIDPDAGDALAFSLPGDGGGRFVVDSGSGQVRVAPGAVLDFESAPSHTLLLRVTDAQGLVAERTIVVTLGDVAEGAPPPDIAPPPPPIETPPPPAPAPEVPSAAAPSAPAPRTAPAEPSSDALPLAGDTLSTALVREALDGRAQTDGMTTAVASRERAARDEPALTLASVAFAPGGAVVPGDWSAALLDALLAQGSTESAAPLRWNALSWRGNAIDVGSPADDATAADDSPSRQFVALAQDPVRVASATLTAGFVWWLTRSGGLLTSILMGIPAWRHVDLLPVLAKRADDDDHDDDLPEPALTTRRDNLVEHLFSNTSRLFGDTRTP